METSDLSSINWSDMISYNLIVPHINRYPACIKMQIKPTSDTKDKKCVKDLNLHGF